MDSINGQTMNDNGQQKYSIERAPSAYSTLDTFNLEKNRSYKPQFAGLYFARLTSLRAAVAKTALAAWDDYEIAGEKAQRCSRVLDVRQGQLSWAVGTVYMDMSLKPNILEDISKDHWLSAPSGRTTYSLQDGSDQMMLEDESGRLRLTGGMLETTPLVTGCIIAVLGTERDTGDFEVIDLRLAELPTQPSRWEKHSPPSSVSTTRNKIAFVSGLSMSGSSAISLNLDLLSEFLRGEAGAAEDQSTAASISRLVILGNSLSDSLEPETTTTANMKPRGKRLAKKYGYDSSTYDPAPTAHLDTLLSSLLPALPITILPGPMDPSTVAIPQQPLHTALFPRSRVYASVPATRATQGPGWFDSTTNPTEVEIEGWRMLLASSQAVEDVLRYVDIPDDSPVLQVMESMLRWRCAAPTAPDTLWCYPYQEQDPFVLKACPHVYAVGCMPEYESRILEGDDGQIVRVLAIPSFDETGVVVLLDTETLEAESIRFGIMHTMDR